MEEELWQDTAKDLLVSHYVRDRNFLGRYHVGKLVADGKILNEKKDR
jgi:hypothetical protein